MKALELWVMGYVLNSLWQVPLVFAAAWVAARMLRSAGPRAEHRVWVGALLLEAVVPAFHAPAFGILDWVKRLLPWGSAKTGGGAVRVLIGAGSQATAEVMRLPRVVLSGALVIYAGCLRTSLGDWLGESGGRLLCDGRASEWRLRVKRRGYGVVALVFLVWKTMQR